MTKKPSELIKSILFFGTDRFSVKSLEHILNFSKNVYDLQVVTTHTNSPLHRFGLSRQIPVLICPSNIKNLQIPEKNKYDIGVVVSFGHFLPNQLLDCFRLESLNVHPSLLPAYRGSSPIQRCIQNGDSVTGVSIISLDKKNFDTGKIFSCESMSVPKYSNYEHLENILANKGGEMLVKVLENYSHYLENAYSQQEAENYLPSSVASFARKSKAPKITRKDVQLGNIQELNVEKVYQTYLAFGHIFPLEISIKNLRLRANGVIKRPDLALLEITIINNNDDNDIIYSNYVNTLYVKCKKGWLAFTKLQILNKDGIWQEDSLDKIFLSIKI